MIETIDAILESSRTPPIVILQADHGPGLGISWGDTSDVTPEQIFDRMAILNSFLLPSNCQPMLYPQISSVNSFRVVLNCIAETEFSLLQDHAFFSGKDPIHNFRNVDIIMHQENSMKFFP